MRLSKRTLVFAALLAAVVGGAVGAHSAGTSASKSLTQWTWPTGLPGTAITADDLTARQAVSDGVDVPSLHRLASAGSGPWGISLLAGSGPNGDVCLSGEAYEAIAQFGCINQASSDQPVVDYVADGGSSPGSVDHVAIVGVARADVDRLTLSLANGTAIPLSLNASRAFSYAVDSPASLPAAVTAYDGSGASLGRENLLVGVG